MLQHDPEFCCEEFRDYCALVVAHTRKMMETAASQRPGKIVVQADKSKLKKTAQERALEMYAAIVRSS